MITQCILADRETLSIWVLELNNGELSYQEDSFVTPQDEPIFLDKTDSNGVYWKLFIENGQLAIEESLVEQNDLVVLYDSGLSEYFRLIIDSGQLAWETIKVISDNGIGMDSVKDIRAWFGVLDSGSMEDAISIKAFLKLIDTGSFIDDVKQVLVQLELLDSGSIDDLIRARVFVDIEDNGSFNDDIKQVLVELGLLDNGSMEDAISIKAFLKLIDTGSFIDNIEQILVSLELTDSVIAHDLINIIILPVYIRLSSYIRKELKTCSYIERNKTLESPTRRELLLTSFLGI